MAGKKISFGYRMIESLNRKFDEFDKDKNGVLTLDEILDMCGTDQKDAAHILKHFDMNGDDQVEREEFKHVGLLLMSNQQFKSFDINGDGTLSATEFSKALKSLHYEQAQIDKIFQRADTDGSGSIDRFEFLNALMHMVTPQQHDASAAADISGVLKAESKVIRKSQGVNDNVDDSAASSSNPPLETVQKKLGLEKKGATKSRVGRGKKTSVSRKGSKKALGVSKASSQRRRRRKESFSTYIYKVLKQVHPDTGISSKAMTVMNSFVDDIFERLASEASTLAKKASRHTLSSREVQTAVRLLLPGELAKHAVSEGTKAVTKFTASK